MVFSGIKKIPKLTCSRMNHHSVDWNEGTPPNSHFHLGLSLPVSLHSGLANPWLSPEHSPPLPVPLCFPPCLSKPCLGVKSWLLREGFSEHPPPHRRLPRGKPPEISPFLGLNTFSFVWTYGSFVVFFAPKSQLPARCQAHGQLSEAEDVSLCAQR